MEQVNYDDAEDAAIETIAAVIIVVKANDPLLLNQSMNQSMTMFRNYLRQRGMTPITLVTHCDLIPADNIKGALDNASAATGSPSNMVFPIANYLPSHTEPDPNIEKQALDVIHASLVSAERYLKLKAIREETKANRTRGTSVPQQPQARTNPTCMRIFVENCGTKKIAMISQGSTIEELRQVFQKTFQLTPGFKLSLSGVEIS